MTFHTEIMMTRWFVSADKQTKQILKKLRKIPLNQRHNDSRVIEFVQKMKYNWERSTRIERLATLGWNEFESCVLLSQLIEHYDEVMSQYKDQLRKYGGRLPPLDDSKLEEYEKVAEEERKKASTN